jgi:23S rRNA pseudouridine1911/1915/1917 synthase
MVRASTEYKKEHKADFGHEKIEVLYEDEYLAVIFKPSGMLSCPYPGSKARTAVEVLEQMMRKRGTFSRNHKPLVVHRLDRDTSGVMMFALTEAAQKKIMDTWQKMVTGRIYHAVAENPENPKAPELAPSGTITDELAYNSHNFGFVPKGENAKKFKTITARTNYKILISGKDFTLFELELDTGRKNQIRAHLASKGYTLAGDENYLARTDPFGRLALHARTLEFDHPFTNEHLRFEFPEPEEWQKVVENGETKKRTPVWKQHKPQKSTKSENLPPPPASRKKLSHMDFIKQGQQKRK